MWLVFLGLGGSLYMVTRIYGDIKAAKNGRLHKRVAKRIITKQFFKSLNKLFK